MDAIVQVSLHQVFCDKLLNFHEIQIWFGFYLLELFCVVTVSVFSINEFAFQRCLLFCIFSIIHYPTYCLLIFLLVLVYFCTSHLYSVLLSLCFLFLHQTTNDVVMLRLYVHDCVYEIFCFCVWRQASDQCHHLATTAFQPVHVFQQVQPKNLFLHLLRNEVCVRFKKGYGYGRRLEKEQRCICVCVVGRKSSCFINKRGFAPSENLKDIRIVYRTCFVNSKSSCFIDTRGFAPSENLKDFRGVYRIG